MGHAFAELVEAGPLVNLAHHLGHLGVLLVSAKDPADVRRVRDAIIGAFEVDMTEVDLVVPNDAGSAIDEVHKILVIPESSQGMACTTE